MPTKKADHTQEELTSLELKQLANLLTNAHNLQLEKYGITVAQFGVLHFLKKMDGLTQSELQQKLGIKGSSMTSLLEQLEKKELIDRIVCPEDGRAKRIYLSVKGRRFFDEQVWGIFSSFEEKLLANFSEQERALLLSWLVRLRQNIESYL
ncbi:UNVERIFIED_CONTAM: DNA-binding MarR family transcriptional regulator [Brevibacillus sp. OAP136]